MPLSGWRRHAALALVAAALVGTAILFLLDPGGMLDGLAREVQVQQRRFHAALSTAIRAVKADEGRALWNLLWLGFLYGVFHAAGPGHGKFVISTYLATSGAGLARGLALTVGSSIVQGLSAIAVVELTVGLLGLTFRDARQSAAWVEGASYALVALLGATIGIVALRRLIRRRRAVQSPAALGDAHPHGRGHDHDRHDHAHGPSAADLVEPLTAGRFAAIVASVGLRPCSGAVLVLLFARALDLPLAGYGAVAGISAGTALTVSALAVMAVYARRTALSLAARDGAATARLAAAADLVAMLGGLLIAAIGVSLLLAALAVRSHPLL